MVCAAALACAAAVWGGARSPVVIRDWLPAPYILAAYYVTGGLFVAPSARLERWLAAWDVRLLGDPTRRFAAWPRVILGYLEIVYMGCFLLVPGGFAALSLGGHAADANRYWTMVVAAELGSFAPLSVFQTRPPWVVERKPVLADRAVHRMAAGMVERVSIRVNTFPSGHAAGSLAVALGVAPAMPLAGALLLLLAISIGIATVAGRYHYVVDVAVGALLAVAIWGAVAAAGV
jgi:membrane-associated phospholipid phosphatase